VTLCDVCEECVDHLEWRLTLDHMPRYDQPNQLRELDLCQQCYSAVASAINNRTQEPT
jgi:hypothetical protein